MRISWLALRTVLCLGEGLDTIDVVDAFWAQVWPRLIYIYIVF